MLLKKKKTAAHIQQLQETAQKHQNANELITQELYRKNVELAHTNRTLSLLRTIDTLVLASDMTLYSLVRGISSALIDNMPYIFCGIFLHTLDSKQKFNLYGFGSMREYQLTQLEKESISGLEIIINKQWIASSKSTKLFNLDDLIKDESITSYISDTVVLSHLMQKTNATTVCLVKLTSRQKVVGVMMVGLPEAKDKIHLNELEHIGRLADAIGIALDNKMLGDENIIVLRKLRSTNMKLKALDEAKDEFISMASHQLRTPLTSVKGYLSMLAEGDAGELNDVQKKFVDQAFFSSQRMVYLISDLLNVSRLKTGKFVIETNPTYLPDVIESEIAQLYETVKARGLTMRFNKPASFSTLMLDETKIRQVIMNFTDNAIYYTQSGGTIELNLKETPKTVEFTVTDSGLGVPKIEQPHLFTKFYRAGNARKARPDGTGLGLFMAKKVVIAQGGAIIFRSKEGHGSTFGFSFPKEKLETAA